MREEGTPLYQSYFGERRTIFIALVHLHLSKRVSPLNVLPVETFEAPDFSNVAILPKEMWHAYYAEALMLAATGKQMQFDK